jgi:hypothetical protein
MWIWAAQLLCTRRYPGDLLQRITRSLLLGSADESETVHFTNQPNKSGYPIDPSGRISTVWLNLDRFQRRGVDHARLWQRSITRQRVL